MPLNVYVHIYNPVPRQHIPEIWPQEQGHIPQQEQRHQHGKDYVIAAEETGFVIPARIVDMGLTPLFQEAGRGHLLLTHGENH